MKRIAICMSALLLVCCWSVAPTRAESPLDGDWVGEFTLGKETQRIRAHFRAAGDRDPCVSTASRGPSD